MKRRCKKCGKLDYEHNFRKSGSGYLVGECHLCRSERQKDWRLRSGTDYFHVKSLTEEKKLELRAELKRLQGFYDKVFDVMYKCFKSGMIGSDIHKDAVKTERQIHKECNKLRSRLNDGTHDICKNNPCSKCAYYIGNFSRGDVGRAKDGCDYKRNVIDNLGIFKGFMKRNEAYVRL